jgi:hypothetical protein
MLAIFIGMAMIVLAEILWQTVQTGLTALRKAILSELRRISQNH